MLTNMTGHGANKEIDYCQWNDIKYMEKETESEKVQA